MVLLLDEVIKRPGWSPRRSEAKKPVAILDELNKGNWLRSSPKKRIEVNQRWLSSTTKLIVSCSSVESIGKGFTFRILHVSDCGVVVRIHYGFACF
ncbi:hypothetical protein F2Q69_00031213 [Brassica cretica]|uniref:Uncharacterized protein n=1 Tax=Brassica cretica TaxID=69181 RepID=A0A8S9RW57_BRACR|nr:hypothetical protein F2Q69_00031213 [Brassica cretica]